MGSMRRDATLFLHYTRDFKFLLMNFFHEKAKHDVLIWLSFHHLVVVIFGSAVLDLTYKINWWYYEK